MCNRFLHRLLLALLGLGACVPVQAQSFVLRTSVFSAGGGQSTGATLILRSTIGQPGIGPTTGGNLLLNGGFWPQAAGVAGPLAVPLATDDAVTTDEDTPVVIDVLSNDTDPGGGPLTLVEFGAPDHGVLAQTGDAIFRYTPDAHFFGEDRFVYTVQNEQGGRAQATVLLTINPVNDAPLFTSIPQGVAHIGTEYSYVARTIDFDGDALTFTAPVLPAWLALVEQTDSTATLAGTPTAADAGEHTVTLVASDGPTSDEQTFSLTVMDALLATPVLLTPEDGAVVDPNGEVLVTWQAVPGAATYILELATNEDFSPLAFSTGDFTNPTRTLRGLEDNTHYFWRVQAVGSDGTASTFSAPFRFSTATSVATEDAAGVPAVFALHPNYPNPFNPTTTLAYDLAQAGPVRLAVYDLFGREVARLVEATQAAGRHEVAFDAGDLASGVYLYRLEAGRFRQVRRMMLVK